MNLVLKLLINALAVFILAYFLRGISVDGYMGAIIVAVVLAVLNAIVKPLLVFLTLPATLVTFGLFLFVINAGIVLLADKLVDGFAVASFWWALLFSVLLSMLQSVLYSMVNQDKSPKNQ